MRHHHFAVSLILAGCAALCGACSGSPIRPDAGLPVAASMESFSVLDYDSGAYASEVRIAATGTVAVTVVSIGFVLPGLPGVTCTFPEPLRVEAGTSQHIFQTLGYIGSGDRSTGSSAMAFALVRDDSGRSTTIKAQGPIVPGSPSTSGTVDRGLRGECV